MRVLIVGGGPCGLVALRNLLERGDFDDVQLVERRDNIGGVWYQPPPDAPDGRADERWPSPAYPGLIANVIPEFLSFSGSPFPAPPRQSDQPFPTLVETHDYLAAFARPLLERARIRLHHEVVDVSERLDDDDDDDDGALGGWRVVMIDRSAGGVGTASGVKKVERWDAVVVTTAWYDNAHYPAVDGLDDVRRTTGRVRHASAWRGPGGYEGKDGRQRVVVVGNANSANEMAAQLAPVARPPVYRSARRPSIFPSLPDDRIEDVGPVLRYARQQNRADAANKIAVRLHSGRTIDDVDYVLFGTGYRPDVPYLRVLEPPAAPAPAAPGQGAPPRALVPLTGGHVQPPRVPSLHRHVLYARNPTLAFVGALISFIPFAMADLTSTWLALAWSPRPRRGIAVPPTAEARLADERARLETLRRLRSEADDPPSDLVSFHFLGRDELPYAQAARAEIVRAAPELGDVLAPWDDAQDARRFAMYATKLDSLYALAGREKE